MLKKVALLFVVFSLQARDCNRVDLKELFEEKEAVYQRIAKQSVKSIGASYGLIALCRSAENDEDDSLEEVTDKEVQELEDLYVKIAELNELIAQEEAKLAVTPEGQERLMLQQDLKEQKAVADYMKIALGARVICLGESFFKEARKQLLEADDHTGVYRVIHRGMQQLHGDC